MRAAHFTFPVPFFCLPGYDIINSLEEQREFVSERASVSKKWGRWRESHLDHLVFGGKDSVKGQQLKGHIGRRISIDWRHRLPLEAAPNAKGVHNLHCPL